MAMLLGGSFVSSVVSEEVYDPVYDTAMNAEFIYQLLPSFYRTVMQDQEVFSTAWSGVLQNIAADLLNLWQIDYSKSLRDVPVISQRKWVEFDLFLEEDFEVDPGLGVKGIDGAFTYDLVEQNLSCTPINRARWDKAYIQLTGTSVEDTIDETTSLAWSIDLNIESVEKYGAVLFGYFGSTALQLSHTLAAAVLGSSSAVNTPVAAILHFDPNGIATVSIDSFVLDLSTDYRFDATYTAGTGAVVLSVVELRYQRLTGTTGTVGSSDAVFTNQFSDPSKNFDTAGVLEGDLLVAFGYEYTIVSVDGSNLVVSPIGLPVDVDNVSYEILGEQEVSSLSMDLPGDAPDPTFSAGQFGVSSLDSRSINTQIYTAPSQARRKGIVLTVDNWRYLDPTVAEIILSLPRLQDVVTSPAVLLYEGTDYSADVVEQDDLDLASTTLRFQEPPLEPLWAEYVGYDERHIRDNFGLNVDLDDISSDIYKSQVRGLYYAYFQGPTLEAIRIGVHLLIGLPIADEAGTVEVVNPAYSGVLGLITVAGRDYLYPNLVGTDLVVGDEVSLFQPLCFGVEVIDYLTDPEWFLSSSIHELQKFHHFQVALDLDAFELDTLVAAASFVEQIKPTWKQALFLVYKNLTDEVDITDDILISLALNIYDTMCDGFLVAYDSAIYEGEEEDWKYSQGYADWDDTSAAMRATSTVLGGTAYIPNGGTVGIVGTGTTWTSDITPFLPAAYVAVGRYSTSSTGETTAGSQFLVDNTDGVFDHVEATDHIDIVGEGTFEVVTVDRNVFSSGTGKFSTTTAFDDPSATFQTDGVQAGDVLLPIGGFNDGAEFEVVSIPSETQISFSGPAVVSQIDSGSGDFTGATVFKDVGATWQTLGVQSGDTLVIGGAGPNAGLEFEVGVVLDEDELTIIGAATPSTGEPFVIERRETFTVERGNQLTLDGPLGFTNTGVTWEVTGRLIVWCQVAAVGGDTSLDFSAAFPGQSGDYTLALLDNDYKQVFYDQFEEFCPDERFTIVLEYTNLNGGGPYPGYTVPSTDRTATTTNDFLNPGDTWTVTLDELTP